MLNPLIKKYKDIIKDYQIKKFRIVEYCRELVAIINIDDNSVLFVRDYVFESEHKYSYHWQNKNGNLIMRWDNKPHWKNLENFPHHKHIKDKVKPSKENNLEKVLEVIKEILKKKV